MALVVQLPRLLTATVEALAHLVALHSRPARRRAAHRILEHGHTVEAATAAQPGEP
ncbi:hypothetical protein ACTG9Q_24685 [Actinokineospora sp. 24-640]